MHSHLRIVGAGLDNQVTTAARFFQGVADKVRQIDQCLGQFADEAVAVLSVVFEQCPAKSDRHRQVAGIEAQGFTCVIGWRVVTAARGAFSNFTALRQ